MQAEQAIFTSVQNGRVQGYHLAARSSGIDERTAQTLTRWGPSHGALCSSEPFAESINFHALEEGRFALSRTLYGLPEYSQRGGFQLFTRFVLLEDARLFEYEFDAASVYRRARIEGQFQLDPRFPTTLPPADLPDVGAAAFWVPRLDECENRLAGDVLQRLTHRERLAVFACEHPLAVLRTVLRHAPKSLRRDVSFATGLKPTANRPFQLHFLPSDTPELRRSAEHLGLTCLSARDQG